MFKEQALKYLNAGLSPLPIVPNGKKPCIVRWQEFCHQQPKADDIEGWSRQYTQAGIGLALGTKVNDGQILIAVDVDDDEMVEHVRNAMGHITASKIGKKGLTIFALAAPSITNCKIKKVVEGKRATHPCVEILCSGSQTVIPPTMHPVTREPYYWEDGELLSHMGDLPVFTDAVLDEIQAIAHGKGNLFIDLNTMVWAGVDGGGNTHDVCVQAVGMMVSRSWEDIQIHHRVVRAKREACIRAGDTYDWPHAEKAIQEWIDSARAKGMTGSSKKKKQVPPERLMANWLIEYLGGKECVVTHNTQMRRFDEGHWPAINVEHLKRTMYMEDETLTMASAKNAVHIAATLAWDPNFGRTEGVDAKHDPKLNRVCLNNGTINLITGDLERWDPDHHLLHKLKIDWDDNAKCPLYDDFLDKTFAGDEDLINVWEEFAGLSLVPDMSYQKMLFLKGPGGNGKGSLLRILTALHDQEAISSVSITSLGNERQRTSLVGKLLNVSGEESRVNMVADDYIKKITGEDPVDVRLLYGEVDNRVFLTVRFLGTVNDMPSSTDTSDALRRRMMILPCLNKVTTPNPNLANEIIAKELPGILKRKVVALRRLRERGHFIEPDASKYEVDQFMMMNDPIRYWMSEEQGRIVPDAENPTKSTELYADFAEWADSKGYKNIPNEMYWGQKLRSMGFDPKQKRVGDGVVRVRNLRIVTARGM